LISGRASGGSPLLKVAVTWPSVTNDPQLSTSEIVSGVGHEEGAEKFATSPVGAATRDAAEQLASGEVRREPADPAITSVTLTVRTAAPVEEYEMPPV
jgi:hypothetical protein